MFSTVDVAKRHGCGGEWLQVHCRLQGWGVCVFRQRCTDLHFSLSSGHGRRGSYLELMLNIAKLEVLLRTEQRWTKTLVEVGKKLLENIVHRER
jgi:hypothetical protein